MKTKHIKKRLEKLGKWYQRVHLNNKIYTTDEMITGEHIWPHVRECLPDDLNGLHVLDIGANACYYSYMMALEGAEVIAVEPNDLYYKQALFLKEYYEKKYNKKLNVTILKKNISEIDLSEYQFDFVLALSILYFIGNQFGGKYSDGALREMKRIVKELTQITDKILVRTRNKVHYSSVAYYTSVFLQYEFYLLKRIDMKRPITLYGRLIRHGDYGREKQYY